MGASFILDSFSYIFSFLLTLYHHSFGKPFTSSSGVADSEKNKRIRPIGHTLLNGLFLLLFRILNHVKCTHQVNKAEAKYHRDDTHDDTHGAISAKEKPRIRWNRCGGKSVPAG